MCGVEVWRQRIGVTTFRTRFGNNMKRSEALNSAARLLVAPPGAEHQPVVLDEPEVLVLDLTGPSSFTTAAGVRGRGGGSYCSAATTAVAALVSVSSLPASSVKETRTVTTRSASMGISV